MRRRLDQAGCDEGEYGGDPGDGRKRRRPACLGRDTADHRPSDLSGTVVAAGPISLDSKNMKVTRDGEEIELLPKEFALLEFLMKHPNEYFTAEALLNRVWSSESETSPDILRVYITRLRKKLDRDGQPSLISTRRGAGYMFEPPTA